MPQPTTLVPLYRNGAAGTSGLKPHENPGWVLVGERMPEYEWLGRRFSYLPMTTCWQTHTGSNRTVIFLLGKRRLWCWLGDHAFQSPTISAPGPLGSTNGR